MAGCVARGQRSGINVEGNCRTGTDTIGRRTLSTAIRIDFAIIARSASPDCKISVRNSPCSATALTVVIAS